MTVLTSPKENENSRAGFADNCANTNRVITGKGVALPAVGKQRNYLLARNRPSRVIVLLIRGALLPVLASALVSCRTSPVVGGYRSATIDPATLKIELSDPIVQRYDEKDRALPVLGSYYTYFTNEWGDISYDHYHQDTNGQQRVRYSHLESGGDHIIHKASKRQELLRGVFGTVYAEKTCYFQMPTVNYHNHFWVTAYANDTEHEVPIVRASKPWGSQTLTQISLIAVFRRPPGYAVVSAVYSPPGKIQHLWVNGSKDGDWVHPSQFAEFADGFLVYSGKEKQREVLTRYGFPETFNVNSYLSRALPPFKAAPSDLQLSVVNLHYEHNVWVRQDQFPSDGPHVTRYLTFVQTSEDSVLDPQWAGGFATAPVR